MNSYEDEDTTDGKDYPAHSFVPCGRIVHVIGTNGGTMPCGAILRSFGNEAPYYCEECRKKKQVNEEKEITWTRLHQNTGGH